MTHTTRTTPRPAIVAGSASLHRRLLAVMLVFSFLPVVVMGYQGYHCARMAVISANAGNQWVWLHALKLRALTTGTVTFFCAAGMALWCASTLAAPFRRLAAFARRVEGGDTGARMESCSIPEANKVAEALNTMLDALERERQRTAQGRALAAIGELTSSIVHEMRNPLSSVSLNLAALRERLRGEEDYEELANIAVEQARRLERMLTDLLAYGSPLQGREEPLPVARMVEETLDCMRPLASDAGVELAGDPGDAGHTLLRADREHLVRALCNLCENAILASPAGGRVTISAAPAPDRAGYIRISVADRGRGVPPPLRDRLFEPFFTTRKHGTGLGLANVRKTAETYGGRAGFLENAGGGSLFFIDLPATAAGTPAEAAA